MTFFLGSVILVVEVQNITNIRQGVKYVRPKRFICSNTVGCMGWRRAGWISMKEHFKPVKLSIDDVAIISVMASTLYPKGSIDPTSKDSKNAAYKLLDKIKRAKWEK